MIQYKSNSRSFAKSLSWRVIATLTTICIVYALTGEWNFALAAGAFEVVLKFALYYAHERIWLRSSFGIKQTKPVVIWLTGLSGSGKSTVARVLLEQFKKKGLPVQWLDGDVTRDFIPSTGFSKEERDRHVLSTGFMARTLESQGINVVASYISPYRETRTKVREMCRHFFEVYLSTPLSTCESRDVKGLYEKARAGKIKNFTGIDDPFEPSESPDLEINTEDKTPEEVAETVFQAAFPNL